MNKRIVVAMLLCLCVTNTLSAQYKSFLFGFRGGFGLSGVSRQNEQIYERQWGFAPSWSFFCDYYFVENYAISAALSSDYLRTSYIIPENDTSINLVKRSISANYVDISVLMKLKTEDFGKFNGYADIGGGIGIKAAEGFNNGNNLVKKARASFTVGAGVQYSIRYSTSAAVGIYYKTGSAVIKELDNGKINSISILATFKF